MGSKAPTPAPNYRPVGFNGTAYQKPPASPAPPPIRPPALPSNLRFNINDVIRFKPTEKGHAVWRDYWRETERIWRKTERISGHVAPPLKVDADGWATEQLWLVMRIFGPHCGNGFENTIETQIEIPVKD